SCRGEFEPLDLDAVGGEVLAVYGQIGSGADSVIRVAAGVDTATNGTVTVNGRALRSGSRPAFQRAGVAYISADRVNEGVFLNTSVTRNVSAGVLTTVQRAGVLRRTLERTLAERVAGRVAFNTGRVTEPVSAYSGGN
ncbi:ATP-binding cassette domain-containing protein, partial [Xanthomonas citri pv. citri]